MLSGYTRFAVYFTPPAGSEFARAGAAWLGWDADEGRAVAHPELGLDLALLTATPRKYGLHATLKPPMHLNIPATTFLDAVDTLAQGLAHVDMGMLCLRPLDGFLAMVCEKQPQPLDDFAATVVRELDPFRAPLTAQQLARRRSAGLTVRQEQLLQDWGYPYVLEEFRFHITLTGRLSPAQMPDALRVAHAWFDPVLENRHRLTDLAVFGEDTDGRFHLLRRFALGG
ncbi:DUF1045 domain-containing protein [Roseinatronobacter alkalisoli]|uniref:DUF1045 domain-containing protein n=1 Tax=Roseinatronobacter alkalisoli TaxID=3028235 RepID=A0ABT5T6B4_9RHOB|nr:DUF1045 domain-containing protein [Roseinatronobacter sp. HJB301]MDD7970648.1 DUF1045 domain-containing protein [Roseinatronobacter sp. HJB301]